MNFLEVFHVDTKNKETSLRFIVLEFQGKKLSMVFSPNSSEISEMIPPKTSVLQSDPGFSITRESGTNLEIGAESTSGSDGEITVLHRFPI